MRSIGSTDTGTEAHRLLAAVGVSRADTARSVLYLQARQLREGEVTQQLNASVIDTRTMAKPVDTQSILDW